MKTALALTCVLSVTGFAGIGRAQEPPVPKPGPEHERLKKNVGVWDASIETFEAPGKPPAVSKGTETNSVIAGGLWLVTDFKSEFGGQPFEGHGVNGYDPSKKKFVGTWVDSWTTGLGITESTFDPATKKETGWMEAPDPTGTVTRTKMETEWKDDNTRVFTLWGPGSDGKDFAVMKITYKRRK